MNTHIRAKVLIPVLLFLVVAIPAALVPIAMGSETGSPPQPALNTDIPAPLPQGTTAEPACPTCQLSAYEDNYYLDIFPIK